jgi:hypothetical protein
MTRRLLATLAVAALALTGAQLAPAAALAAGAGPGYDYRGDPHSHLGGYLDPDGTVSYCIDAGKSSPLGGPTSDEGLVDHVNDLGASGMRKLAYVLLRHGNTRDADTAAAVALVVWGLADPADHAARGGDGFVITRAPAERRATILELAARFRDEAERYRTPDPGAGDLQLTVEGDHDRALLGVHLSPAAATGTVVLTNGVFADTGLASREGVADGEQLAIDVQAPTGVAAYELRAEGSFAATGHTDGTVHLYRTPGAQTTVSAGTRVPMEFDAATAVQIEVPKTIVLPRVAG